MLKVNCVATASADREGGSEPLLTSGRADRQTDPTALPIVGARTDDALAFLSAYLPACLPARRGHYACLPRRRDPKRLISNVANKYMYFYQRAHAMAHVWTPNLRDTVVYRFIATS